ncbi:MAG: gamma carbonic anhydrase family protein [Gammaproteobacteria bacterium]
MDVRSFEGLTPSLGASVYVDPRATVIGDVAIGDESSVWPCTVIRGDIHRIRIGRRSSVQDGSVLHVTHAGPYNPDGYPLTVGDEVTIGHQVTLHGCTLGNRILVGMASVVLDGAVIEDEVVLGAGSLVPPGKVLASGQLYLGRPARAVRALTEKERAYFRYTADRYVQLAARYLADAGGG